MQLNGSYTTKGLALAAKLLTGTALTITKVTAGAGQTATGATALAQEKQTLAANSPVRKGSSVTIPATLAAAQVTTGYTLTEVGVYARDPSEGEILYRVYRLDTPVNITAGGGLVLRLYLTETVSGTEEVAVTCSPAGLLVEEDLEPVNAAISKKPDALKVSTTLHVAKTGSDTTGDGSETKPFLTIQKAVDSLPKLLIRRPTIHVHAGTYEENVLVEGFGALDSLILDGVSGETVKLNTLKIRNCVSAAPVYLANLELIGTSGDGYNWSLFCDSCSYIRLDAVTCTQAVASSNYGAFTFQYTPTVKIMSCTISNKSVALDVLGSTVYLNNNCTGTGNTVGIRCGSAWGHSGGFVQKGGANIAGEEQKGFGGQIW